MARKRNDEDAGPNVPTVNEAVEFVNQLSGEPMLSFKLQMTKTLNATWLLEYVTMRVAEIPSDVLLDGFLKLFVALPVEVRLAFVHKNQQEIVHPAIERTHEKIMPLVEGYAEAKVKEYKEEHGGGKPKDASVAARRGARCQNDRGGFETG